MDGKFITFEGSDGAGKTTALNNIVAQIKPRLGDQLVVTREPGGDKISEEIRNIIVASDNTDMDARTEALLFAAARRQHLVETVLPALRAGKLVLCDRFVDSSIAYQGAGRQIGTQAIADLNEFATDGLVPDATLYFDIPVQVGLDRIMQHRTDEVNRLDKQQHDFYVQVHNAYNKLAVANPERIKKINADQPVDTVTSAAMQVLQQVAPEYF